MVKKISLCIANRHPQVDADTQTLHHLCAIKARGCWGFWNRGYPVARVLDHRPRGDDYIMALDIPADSTLHRVDDHPSGAPEYAPSVTELAIFLVDLYRLKLNNLAGCFDLAILKRKISFGRYPYSANEFVLMPSFRDIAQTGRIEKTDTLTIAKRAASIVLPDEPGGFNRLKSIRAILGKLSGIPFYLNRESAGDGCLVLKIEPHEIRLYAEHSDARYRVYPEPNGSISSPSVKCIDESGKEMQLTVTFDPDGADKTPWVDALLRWENRCKAWRDGERSDLGRDLLGTLCAEEHYAGRYIVDYESVDAGGKTRQSTRLKIRPRDKQTRINGDDIYDHLADAGDMRVRLISDDKNDNALICRLDKVDDIDKFKITVAATGNDEFSPPAKGRLHPINAGDESLRRRKSNLIHHAITGRILYAHMNGQVGLDWWGGDEWRLQCRHSLQTLQGPPGTGKTWTATRIVEDILARNPCARILVCAKEHHALDHLADKLNEAICGGGYHVERIRSNPDNAALPPATTGERIADELIAALPTQAAAELEAEKHNEGMRAGWVKYLAMKTASVVCTTTLDRMIWEFARQGEYFDFAIVEEAGKCYPSELVGPLSLAMNALLIGDHMQLPPFELREIQNSIAPAVDAGFVAYDENKGEDRKANGYKLLNLAVPLWNKEEFAADDSPLKSNLMDDIGRWLTPFAHLHDAVDGVPGDMLKGQYRMFDELSDLIGRLFYGAQFEMPHIAGRAFRVELPELFRRYGRLLLIDHPHCTEGDCKEEPGANGSLLNRQEAKCARELLQHLLDANADAVVITPYQAQVDAIKKDLSAAQRKHVYTVDGFQGKEANFVILSLVRNNDHPGVSRRWGFVRDPRRLNVALSRAREGLAVIASARHIELTGWDDDGDHIKRFLDAVREMDRVISQREVQLALSNT